MPMLSLTRGFGEDITIGDNEITVTPYPLAQNRFVLVTTFNNKNTPKQEHYFPNPLPLVLKEKISIAAYKTYSKQILLQINAPKGVSVHRKEIWDKIQSEKTEKSNALTTHPS